MRTFRHVNILNDPRTDLTWSSQMMQTQAEKYQKTRAPGSHDKHGGKIKHKGKIPLSHGSTGEAEFDPKVTGSGDSG